MTTYSVLLFKPDAASHNIEGNHGTYPIHVIGGALLCAAGLEITDRVSTRLLPEHVSVIYKNALRPNPQEDAIYGTEWKHEVVRHMSSGVIEAYFVGDDNGNAEWKTKIIKNFLRMTLSAPNNVVENIAHVPDEDEFPIVRDILLGYE